MFELEGKYGTAKVFTDDVDQKAIAQVIDLLNQPYAAGSKIRMMPDIHAGAGCTIGTTMTITDRVCPNLVGVDIGCGMYVVKISGSIDPERLDTVIRKSVPAGFAIHPEESQYARLFDFGNLRCKDHVDAARAKRSIGTLGGGNHFIEIGEADDEWYIFIHTGSRNFGLQVCKYHAAKAKANGSKYLLGDDMKEYFDDMIVAQRFASQNRNAIVASVITALDIKGEYVCDTIHNYIDFTRGIIRKGAVRAEAGETLVIPMNMRDGVLLCKGKGNPDWNYSAPHGAGRVLSRAQAKRQLDMAEFESQMEGIYSTSV